MRGQNEQRLSFRSSSAITDNGLSGYAMLK
jgi:hypothetical protein